MSPRAAWRLERLGFGPVYDYAAGKADWMAAGRPTTRADASEQRAIDAADPDVTTCRPTLAVADLPAEEAVVVTNDEEVVLGRVPIRGRPEGDIAEDVMDPGPATVRANEPLEPLLQRMARSDVPEVLVTTPEGRLLGAVRRPPSGPRS